MDENRLPRLAGVVFALVALLLVASLYGGGQNPYRSAPVSAAFSAGLATPSAPATFPSYPQPFPSLNTDPALAGLFDVGGYELFMVCFGHNGPTAVLDSGLGWGAQEWYGVIPDLAHVGRVCAYDRAGVGLSDPSSGRRTSLQMAADLHNLLSAAQIAPPYVLVGHSIGEINVQLYTLMWPEEVAALVLLGDDYPERLARPWAVLPDTLDRDPGDKQALERRLRAFEQGRRAEEYDAETSARQVQASAGLGDVLLRVVVQRPELGGPGPSVADGDLTAAEPARRAATNGDVGPRSSTGKRYIAQTVGGYAPIQEPDLVMAVIIETVRDLRLAQVVGDPGRFF